VRLMFPLVSSVSEIEEARAILDECRAELVHSGLRVPEKTDVGVTVETPAAALMADKLADHVDFFSIGTNDLAQFTMAADRANPAVSPLASALHPAVLRLVQMVVEAAHEHHKSVGVCGEVASDPAAVPLLVGLGIDELSVSPPAIPLVKAAIRSISLGQARSRAEAALNLEDQDAVLAVSRQISATDGSPA
jgi:phosphoenolpyruvate-protein kinase (PTS system EI component)